MSPSMLRVIIGGAVVALLIAFVLSGPQDARRAREREPQRVTGALEAQPQPAAPPRIRDEVATAAAVETPRELSGREGLMPTIRHRIDAGAK